MEKKPTPSQPIEKPNKCSLDPGKEPKKKGNADNNWPKPEFRTFECRAILQQFICILVIRSFCKNRPEGGSAGHIYLNSYSMYINFIFFI